MIRKIYLVPLCLAFMMLNAAAQPADRYTLLKPDRVFDGETMHEGWVVLVKNKNIIEAGALQLKLPAGTEIIELKGATLMPGMIEGHAHLLLHPYNETPWNDQVLKESRAERIARAVTHAKATLLAGFTTVRDLGTEGAAYDDVGLKTAISKGIIPGPHLLIATKAIVATGSYGPKSGSPDIEVPKGAAEAANAAELVAEVRNQIGHGADIIKIYADYRYGPNGEAMPTFTADELQQAGEVARSSGRPLVVHAVTVEGMRRAIAAGAATIEHGDNATPEIFALMKANGVALCPTLAAGESVLRYNGWQKGKDADPERIMAKKKSFAQAMQSGVRICMGGDVGVFTHGDNALEMELMVEYGMSPLAVLQAATSVNADVFGIAGKAGRIRPGMPADIIAVNGNPYLDIRALRSIVLVMKQGVQYK